MKNKFICVLLTVMFFILVGCDKKDEKIQNTVISTPTNNVTSVEPNAKVVYLRFYAPMNYTYRPDLRGLAYSEEEKKVYINGDYENDPNSVIYLIVAKEYQNKDISEFVNEVNNKLSDNDVKFGMRKNSKKQEVYARENYTINGIINYAYLVGKSGDIYVVNIKGPQDKQQEIDQLAKNVYDSLLIS